MQKKKTPDTALMLLVFSLVVLAIVVAVGALIKKIEITIGLLTLPILLGAASAVLSIRSLTQNDSSRTKSVVLLIVSTVVTVLITLFMLMLRGLEKLT